MKSRPGFCTLSSPTRASIATLAELNPMANVLMLPYLYDSSDQMWQVLEREIGDELMDSFDGTGVVPLSWCCRSTRPTAVTTWI